MPYRSPAPRLPSTVTLDEAQNTFLNDIKPWTKEKWDKSFGSPDEHTKRNRIKEEIRAQLLDIQKGYCAFCGLNLKLAHKVHREHIAPQYKYPDYIFELENLVLACNFCNDKKGRYNTIDSSTGNYRTENFNILHPHRDDFSAHLSCDFTKYELVFKIIGPDKIKAQNTIDRVGLAEPHLVSLRGAIILKEKLPSTGPLNWIVKRIISVTRKSSL